MRTLRNWRAKVHRMPPGPDDKAQRGRDAAGPRRAAKAPGRPDDAAAEQGSIQDDERLERRVA